ncbi:MAG: bifunctional (p)ppGpp synthetase/guanosine-3',5'-bis(diphosphate) 3'-pyrophosphohydrolase [Paludibacteraceae bacterium]|nr:bifunctional (p)ppGpp synthetase/guanosine-3',5'-bis(diphosphate) 3'-pyrophosphohydrolase [Paludibacteraceae bacterium]
MGNRYLDSTFLDKAILYAVKAHANTERRAKGFPYIIHPLEAMAITATMTSDQELLAAAVLHDTVEDTSVTEDDLRREFGNRVADLVKVESDEPVPEADEESSWHARKQAAIDRIAAASRDGKMVALGDKLSNMRAIARDWERQGESLWTLFRTHDKSEHAWHYRGLANSLKDLSGTEAYQEFVSLIERVFGKK